MEERTRTGVHIAAPVMEVRLTPEVIRAIKNGDAAIGASFVGTAQECASIAQAAGQSARERPAPTRWRSAPQPPVPEASTLRSVHEPADTSRTAVSITE